MKKFLSLPGGNALLAVLACMGFVVVWSLPALIAGDSFAFFHHLEARNLAATGIFSITDTLGRLLSTSDISLSGVVSSADGRLTTLLVALLSRGIAWDDTVLWTLAGSTVLAVGLFFWWATIVRLLSRKVAWTTLVITALMPIYFREAVWFDGYNLALTCVAASAASYVWLRDKRPIVALLVAGLLFGASVSAKDVFLIMVPWIGCTFLWKKQWKGGVIFFVATFVVYLLPYISDIQTLGYPVNQNLARVWPGTETVANDTYLHLYPDPYTYYFEREAFDEEFIAGSSSMSDEKLMLSYGLADGFFRRIRLGFWLIAHDIPPFFQRHTVGGAFVWIFALPGLVALWRREKTFVLWLAGLAASSFVVIRFVLLYERGHFMNIGWMVALLIAYGICEISMLQKYWRTGTVATVLTAVCAVQFLQANRYEMAALYNKSTVAELRSTAAMLSALPDDAVIATDTHPNNVATLAMLSDKTIVLFREDTVQEFPDAFATYSVTHALNYSTPTSVADISSPVPQKTEPSAAIKWLVHLIR